MAKALMGVFVSPRELASNAWTEADRLRARIGQLEREKLTFLAQLPPLESSDATVSTPQSAEFMVAAIAIDVGSIALRSADGSIAPEAGQPSVQPETTDRELVGAGVAAS